MFPTIPNLILCYYLSMYVQDKISNIINRVKFITNNVIL